MASTSDGRAAPTTAPRHDGDGKSIPEVASELWELGTAYARQETIDPLKGLGRFLGFGVGGAVALGIGMVLLLLSVLRALQTETGSTFTGNLSWAPYLIVLAVGTLFIVLALARISQRKGPGA